MASWGRDPQGGRQMVRRHAMLAAIVVLIAGSSGAAQETSREYKLPLHEDAIRSDRDGETAAAILAELVPVLRRHGTLEKTALKDVKTRSVRFLDTIGCALSRNGFMFRVRDGEATL